MRKGVFCIILIMYSIGLKSQNKILWSSEIEITEESFLDEAPNISGDNVEEFMLHTTFEFGYQMSTAQFAFTKNFNKYVEAYYIPEYSWIEKGESLKDLMLYANVQFDISELFARKFRKKLYESKKFGSNSNFFVECHDSVSSLFNFKKG